MMTLPSWEAYEDDPEKDEQGTVLCDVNRIYVKDSEMQTIYYEQIPGSGLAYGLLSFSVNAGGMPVILIQNPDGRIYLQQMKKYREEEPKQIWMDKAGMGNSYGDIYITEGGFLFCRGSSLYRYLFENQTCEKIMDLAGYGIFPDDVLYLGMSGGKVEVIDNYGDGQPSEYTLLTEGESGKLQLSLGVMQLSQKLENTVTLFNRYSDDIRVEIVEYYNEVNGYERGLEQLKLDIVRGEAPDILDVSMMDYELFAGRGILADLYGYMEQDREFTKEMLMPGIVEAYELDGHLYNIAPAFILHSMWGNNSVIKDRHGVSLPGLVQISKLYNGNISFIGYPTVSGDSGTAVSFRDSQLAINAGRENQDVAW